MTRLLLQRISEAHAQAIGVGIELRLGRTKCKVFSSGGWSATVHPFLYTSDESQIGY